MGCLIIVDRFEGWLFPQSEINLSFSFTHMSNKAWACHFHCFGHADSPKIYQHLRWQPLPLRCGTENGWEPNPWHWPPSVAEAQGDATDVMKSEPLELRSPQDGFGLLHFSHVILYHMIAEFSAHMKNDICLKAINQVALATCNFCTPSSYVMTCNRSSSRRGMPSPPAALWVGRLKRGVDGFLWFLGF